VLVVALQNPQVARDAAELIDAGRPVMGALGVVKRYVDGHHGASFSLLHPSLSTIINESVRWQLGVPETDDPVRARLAQIYILRLAAAKDGPALENALRADAQSIAYVHYPAVRQALDLDQDCQRGEGAGIDWGLVTCHFPNVWTQLDSADSAPAIGIIDQGGATGHPALTGKITLQVPALGASTSTHASSVAAIIAATRKERPLRGCCSAELHLYNVWTANEQFDPCAYYQALLAVATPALPVVNLSIGGTAEDKTEEDHVKHCLASNVVLVAAIGNLADNGPATFPARYAGVVAVGATTASDVPVACSTRGAQMWISAPGERILTIDGDRFGWLTGTSFAAPFVTAAVWLARRNKPCLTVDEIRDLLKHSVAPCTVPLGGRSADLGHGRLDMVTLKAALDAKTCM